ncbi:uncharacterized [Tachysurus ichikawai]
MFGHPATLFSRVGVPICPPPVNLETLRQCPTPVRGSLLQEKQTVVSQDVQTLVMLSPPIFSMDVARSSLPFINNFIKNSPILHRSRPSFV